MRTKIELPDELLVKAKTRAALAGVSLREFFIEAVEQKLAHPTKKIRRDPPLIGGQSAPRVGVLTPEQIDKAMFG